VQLPAWNEALGLPRPWDQQWSLRMQQVLAYESDLLEYPDLFEGSHVVEGLVSSIVDGARAELAKVLELGGVVSAVESGYLKSALVASLAARRRRIETGEDVVVGVNQFTETEPSPLTAAGAEAIEQVDPAVERTAVEAVAEWRAGRDKTTVDAALDRLRAEAAGSSNLMPATLACVQAGVTTGEWAAALREVFGEYRAPTGLTGALSESSAGGSPADAMVGVRARVRETAAALGTGRLRMLVGKPGLDGHSNGAEQIAVRARDAGFEVVYQGIRLTPAQIVAAAVQEDVDLVGLSVLSGAHLAAVPAVLDGLHEAGAEIPVVVGGIIPAPDAEKLRAAGVARVFTPRDFAMTEIVDELVTVVRTANGLS
jgi:(2R)-ethylmalonyl-CoA mutase